MTKKFEEEIESIISELQSIDASEIDVAIELKANAFALIKTTEYFDEYLQKINDIHFKSQHFLYNTGHHAIRDDFENGKKLLISTLSQIKREAHYGAFKKELLPAPEKVTLHWLFKNCSISIWISFFAVLAIVFVCGALLENKFSIGTKIAPWLLDPIDSLKAEAASLKKK